jgi:uncharacterized membrane protein YfcA
LDWRVFLGFGLMNAAGSLGGALIHVWVDNPILAFVLGILLVFAGFAGVLRYDAGYFAAESARIASAWPVIAAGC